MRRADVLVSERNPFRISFFLMMAVKGVSYGVFGVRTTPEHSPVQTWEQVAGCMLLGSCVAVLIGLFMNPTWNRSSVLRWGYLAFGVSATIFSLGSLGYGVDGFVASAVNAMFAYAGYHDFYREYHRFKIGLGA